MHNREFYEYCLSGNVYMDRVYFTREANIPAEVDDQFSTLYDWKLAKILAHQTSRDFILRAISKIKSMPEAPVSQTLQWTVSKVSLVELMYALHTCGVFNHGNIDLKQIAVAFETMFGVKLNNYAKVFAEVKMRKTGNTVFLDQMKERLSILISDFNRQYELIIDVSCNEFCFMCVSHSWLLKER